MCLKHVDGEAHNGPNYPRPVMARGSTEPSKFSAAPVSVRTIPEVQSEVLTRMVFRSVWWLVALQPAECVGSNFDEFSENFQRVISRVTK